MKRLSLRRGTGTVGDSIAAEVLQDLLNAGEGGAELMGWRGHRVLDYRGLKPNLVVNSLQTNINFGEPVSEF